MDYPQFRFALLPVYLPALLHKTMQDLVWEGMIYRVAGRGTYPVAAKDRYASHFGSVEDLMSLSLDTECEIVNPLQRKVDVDAASRLRLSSDEIFTVTFIRRHASIPFCYTSVYLPPPIGGLLVEAEELGSPGRRSRVTVIGLLDSCLTEDIMSAEQSISASAAPVFAASHLERQPGEPVLRIDRLYSGSDDVPVELAISYFDPEHYTYRVKLRRRPH